MFTVLNEPNYYQFNVRTTSACQINTFFESTAFPTPSKNVKKQHYLDHHNRKIDKCGHSTIRNCNNLSKNIVKTALFLWPIQRAVRIFYANQPFPTDTQLRRNHILIRTVEIGRVGTVLYQAKINPINEDNLKLSYFAAICENVSRLREIVYKTYTKNVNRWSSNLGYSLR